MKRRQHTILKRGHQTRDKGQGHFLLPEGGSDSPENRLLECPYLKKTCPTQTILIFFALGCLDQKRGLILRIMVNAEITSSNFLVTKHPVTK
jgi:hypothetical protein